MKASETNGKVRVGLIQMRVSEDPAENLERALLASGKAAEKGAAIICLPELYRTRYFPQSECADLGRLSETIPGESTRAFSALAQKHRVVIIVPVFEQGESGAFHNTAVVIDRDGGILPVYRKVHVPFDPLFYEKHYFVPGDGFRVYDTGPARFAVLICYDQWFPEAARAAALMGAGIIFYPTAIGWIGGDRTPAEGDWQGAWETVQRGHAIANGIHVAAVNRVGQEGELLFWGGSFAADAFGNVIARAGEGEETLVVDLDLSMNKRVRESWGFLNNRRPDTYGILTRPVIREYPPATALPATPKKLGFSMPAEWDPHDSVWLAWPHDSGTFGDIPAVENTYLKIISALAPGERVNLLVRDGTMERVRGMFHEAGIDAGQVDLIPFDHSDVWFRDYGPTFVVNPVNHQLGMVAWEFNAWGNKYPGHVRDGRIPSCLNTRLGLPLFRPGIVLEGGSIDVNGRGAVLTTKQCLLNPNRNPGLPKREVESYLREFLGASTVIWLAGGIAGDDTDGHVDDIARFVNPSTVVCAREEDEGDENYRVLRENERILRKARDQDGKPLTLIPIPMPGGLGRVGTRLPASYLNFYIGNRVVLVPTFSDPDDEKALGILRKVFPGREVTGIDCRALVEGMGAIHCITQQQPRVD